MVFFFTSSTADGSVPVYMGKDKEENEFLIRYGWQEDGASKKPLALPALTLPKFHVDKLSSAHVYLRLPKTMPWTEIPPSILQDAAQLTKANSIAGNKLDHVAVLYTPHSNLEKTGEMAVGQVSFHNPRLVKRVHVPTRLNAVVNRLNKTKSTMSSDDFIEERRLHDIEVARAKRQEARLKRKAELELEQQRLEEQKARDYRLIWQEDDETSELGTRLRGAALEEDFM